METVTPTNTLTISKDDLQEMLRTLIKAAKEPTEEQAAKIADDKMRYERSRRQAQQQMEAEETAKQARQSNCGHKKENGKWATGGQIIGGKYGMLVCQHCQKSWFAKFSQEVISQINAGDLTLHQADPTSGWQAAPPIEMEVAPS